MNGNSKTYLASIARLYACRNRGLVSTLSQMFLMAGGFMLINWTGIRMTTPGYQIEIGDALWCLLGAFGILAGFLLCVFSCFSRAIHELLVLVDDEYRTNNEWLASNRRESTEGQVAQPNRKNIPISAFHRRWRILVVANLLTAIALVLAGLAMTVWLNYYSETHTDLAGNVTLWAALCLLGSPLFAFFALFAYCLGASAVRNKGSDEVTVHGPTG